MRRLDSLVAILASALPAAFFACGSNPPPPQARVVPSASAPPPIASTSAASLVYDQAQDVHAGLMDKQTLLKEAANDPARNIPTADLLTGLRGKDVLLVFVESYGRTALDLPVVESALDAGERRLQKAGFSSRSGFLTSPTFGGLSWLAQNPADNHGVGHGAKNLDVASPAGIFIVVTCYFVVELPGIEPGSYGIPSRLLRAQSAMPLLGSPDRANKSG